MIGTNYYSTYDKFYVFDVTKEIWESPPTTEPLEKSFLDPIFNKNNDSDYHFDITNTTLILGIILGVIGFTFLASYVLGIWVLGYRKLHNKISNLLKRVKNEIWKPRYGTKTNQ